MAIAAMSCYVGMDGFWELRLTLDTLSAASAVGLFDVFSG